MKLVRYEKNPILKPLPRSDWENVCACNPAAWYDGRKVRLLYRGGPDTDLHPIFFGLAESRDGFRFNRVGRKPVFGPSADGFDAGCVEDPRIIRLDDTYYVTYAARLAPPGPYYRGKKPLNIHVPANLKVDDAPAAARWNLTRTGLAATRDFRTWKRLGPITPSDVDDRDAIIFPERIGGRFFMIHRPSNWFGRSYPCKRPSIWMCSSHDLLAWKDSRVLAQPAFPWEAEKIGGSTPPIRTSRGWLMLYHGVDRQFTYRVGAMLLDLNNPMKILARLPEPILEPEAVYERIGVVKNVVFPCGNVVIDGTLFVYYGGADKVCCVATAPLKKLVGDLLKHPFRSR